MTDSPYIYHIFVFNREQAENADNLDEGPVCSICYASRPEVVHRPCGHSEFCMVCSLQCDVCPLCRTAIEDRDELAEDSASAAAAATPGGTNMTNAALGRKDSPTTAAAATDGTSMAQMARRDSTSAAAPTPTDGTSMARSAEMARHAGETGAMMSDAREDGEQRGGEPVTAVVSSEGVAGQDGSEEGSEWEEEEEDL